MLKRYEEFLKEVDKELNRYFKEQQQYIKCHIGCNECCKIGEYPFSRLEAEYLMQGFQSLPKNIRDIIRYNIKELKIQKDKFLKSSEPNKKRFLYQCPFLINDLCVLYKRRGLTCRIFGLAYLSDGKIILPECVNSGLNYSQVFDKSSGMVSLQNPIKNKLTIDRWLDSPLAEKYALEAGEIRSLINWF